MAREEERAVGGMGRKPRAGQTQYPGYGTHDKQGVPGKHCLPRSLRPGHMGGSQPFPQAPRGLAGPSVEGGHKQDEPVGFQLGVPSPPRRLSSWEPLLPLRQPQPRARSEPGRADPTVSGAVGSTTQSRLSMAGWVAAPAPAHSGGQTKWCERRGPDRWPSPAASSSLTWEGRSSPSPPQGAGENSGPKCEFQTQRGTRFCVRRPSLSPEVTFRAFARTGAQPFQAIGRGTEAPPPAPGSGRPQGAVSAHRPQAKGRHSQGPLGPSVRCGGLSPPALGQIT